MARSTLRVGIKNMIESCERVFTPELVLEIYVKYYFINRLINLCKQCYGLGKG